MRTSTMIFWLVIGYATIFSPTFYLSWGTPELWHWVIGSLIGMAIFVPYTFAMRSLEGRIPIRIQS